MGIELAARGLRLYLADRHRFRMRLAVWDPIVGTVIVYRELAGSWHRTRDGLELRAPERTLSYEWSRERSRVLIWRRSSLPTFADGFSLMPAAESNTSLLEIGRDK